MCEANGFFSPFFSYTIVSEGIDNRKKEECDILLDLDFSFACGSSERFSAVLKESDREFSFLATLVCPSSHLPSLLRSTDFLSAFRTLGHEIAF